MSFETSYLLKAHECERMALDAIDFAKRIKLQVEAQLWREIARDIAKQEAAKP